MNPLFRQLTWALMMTGVLVSLAVLATPRPVHADTCTPIATLPADLTPSGPLDTGANVIATFNNARQQEGCNVSLSIDPAAYDAAPSEQQTLMLVNAERQDRSLGALKLDITLISQIAKNHSNEEAQYGYATHPSPINQPGDTHPPHDRLFVNPAVMGHSTSCPGEVLYWANWFGGPRPPSLGSPGAVIFWAMYQDSASQWGHRQTILGHSCTFNGNNPFGQFDWIGVGIVSVQDKSDGSGRIYFSLDFLDDANVTTYTPPGTADTQPPTMDSPTIVDANTVQVINVTDDHDGSTSGVVGVTGVVFYVGSAVVNGNFQTVSATKGTDGTTWTAPLSVTDLTTLHAVAVDGSGNYTDCVGYAPFCPPA